MSHSLGTGDKKALNVDLNLVPFIDLLSCLTAFLMVTATWINIARIDIQPSGLARDGSECIGPECDDPKLSVLIDPDEIWVGVSRVNDFQKIAKLATGYDWAQLEVALKQQKASAFFAHKTAIEIAAESTPAHPVTYQSLIAAMDIAVKAGFRDVGLTDPQGLSARPTL